MPRVAPHRQVGVTRDVGPRCDTRWAPLCVHVEVGLPQEVRRRVALEERLGFDRTTQLLLADERLGGGATTGGVPRRRRRRRLWAMVAGGATGAPVGTWTVLFTDQVGSTAMRVLVGEETFDGVRADLDARVAGALSAHGVVVTKSTGDGVMGGFTSTAAALQCAVAIQQAVAERNRIAGEGVPGAEVVALRVGISVGDAVVDNGDLQGTAVVESARLSAVADGGTILCSEAVRVVSANRSGCTFGPARRDRAEGVAGSCPGARGDLGTAALRIRRAPSGVPGARSARGLRRRPVGGAPRTQGTLPARGAARPGQLPGRDRCAHRRGVGRPSTTHRRADGPCSRGAVAPGDRTAPSSWRGQLDARNGGPRL